MIDKQIEIIKEMYNLGNDSDVADLIGVSRAYISKVKKTGRASTDISLILDDLMGLGYADIQNIGKYIGKNRMVELRKRQFDVLTRNAHERGAELISELLGKPDNSEIFEGEKSSLARHEED